MNPFVSFLEEFTAYDFEINWPLDILGINKNNIKRTCVTY